MAYLIETSTWETGVYQIETSDWAEGGSSGLSNWQPSQLANRTKKIYDTLVENGIFIDPGDEVFVGQGIILNASFEGTVLDNDLVYYDIGNIEFAKALADGSASQAVVGYADVTNSLVRTFGLIQTPENFNPGDIMYLSDINPGEMTDSDTGVPIGVFIKDGIISFTPAASKTAASASLAPGSVTPDKLSESYYAQSVIDTKCSNWDTAYSEMHQWDGGATNLVAATARTSLGLTGDVTTHDHSSTYYSKTQIDTKCSNWDTAYTERRVWDGGATGLNATTARASLGLSGDVSTHNHDGYYYTKAQIDAKCGNWDSAYSERRQWDGSATNLNASTARTSLGLTGDVTTHNHNSIHAQLAGNNTYSGSNIFSEKIVIPLDQPTSLQDGCIWMV